jgi:hypothetical protein
MLSVLLFGAGAAIGWLVARSGGVVKRIWPIVLRAQILLTATVLTGVAVWRVSGFGQLGGPLLLSISLLVPFAGAAFTRGRQSSGEVALESWAVSANSGYWVVPAAAALAGPTGTMVAALVTVPNTIVYMWWTAILRRDAPTPQTRSTGWADYSPLLAAAAGLGLRFLRPAPSSTSEILTWIGPLLAFSGAALVSGSVLHPHNLAITRSRDSLWRWSWLTGLRVASCVVIFTTAPSRPLKIVAVLTAFSAPAFNPIQLTVLYGYRSSIVNGAVRWGWFLAPFGLAIATYVRYP